MPGHEQRGQFVDLESVVGVCLPRCGEVHVEYTFERLHDPILWSSSPAQHMGLDFEGCASEFDEVPGKFGPPSQRTERCHDDRAGTREANLLRNRGLERECGGLFHQLGASFS